MQGRNRPHSASSTRREVSPAPKRDASSLAAAAAAAARIDSRQAASSTTDDMSSAMRRFRDLMAATPTRDTSASTNRPLSSVAPRPPQSARLSSRVVETLRVEVQKASPQRNQDAPVDGEDTVDVVVQAPQIASNVARSILGGQGEHASTKQPGNKETAPQPVNRSQRTAAVPQPPAQSQPKQQVATLATPQRASVAPLHAYTNTTPTPLSECVILRPPPGAFNLANHWPSEWEVQRTRLETHSKAQQPSRPNGNGAAAFGYYKCGQCNAPVASLGAKLREAGGKRGAGLFDRVFQSAVDAQLTVPDFMSDLGEGLHIILRCSNCKGFLGDAVAPNRVALASDRVAYVAKPVPPAYAAFEGPLNFGDDDESSDEDSTGAKPPKCVVVKVKKLPATYLPACMQEGDTGSGSSGDDDYGDGEDSAE